MGRLPPAWGGIGSLTTTGREPAERPTKQNYTRKADKGGRERSRAQRAGELQEIFFKKFPKASRIIRKK